MIRLVRQASRLVLTAGLLAFAAMPATQAQDPDRAPNAHLPTRVAPKSPTEGFQVPPNWTLQLENGLNVTFIDWGMTPTVDIRVEVRAGNIDEGEDTWLSDLTTELMLHGSAGRSVDEIARAFGEMGGSLHGSVLTDRSTYSSFVLSEAGPQAIALLADVVQRPDFPADRLASARSTISQMAENWLQQPGAIASRAAGRHLYPQGHPFHHTIPTQAQLDGYTLDQIRTFYRDHFGAQRTHIYITGQFDAAAMEAAVREHFGDWPAGPADQGIEAIPMASGVVHLIDRPGAPQSTILLAYPVGPITSPDAAAIEVMDTAVGGWMMNRLAQSGASYHPQSFINWTRGGGMWTFADDLDQAQTVSGLHDLLTIIDYARFQPLQIDGVANWMIARNILSIGSRFSLVAQIGMLNEFGLPPSHMSEYDDNIRAVTAQDVMRVVQQYMARDRMLLVVVGDLAVIEDGIRQIPALSQATVSRESERPGTD